MRNRLIAITGGIGSGKSMVSRIVSVMGMAVYDCDKMAQYLMQHDHHLKQAIVQLMGHRAYDSNGCYDRAWVAQQVFADRQLLARLNALVHPAVVADVQRWMATDIATRLSFVETALLRQSGLEQHVAAVWRVVAPEGLRVSRVQLRSGLDERQIRERMAAQMRQETPFDHELVLVNDDTCALLPQVIGALNNMVNKN